MRTALGIKRKHDASPPPQGAGACPVNGITAVRRPAASRMNDVAMVHFNVKRWWSPSSTPHKPTSR